MKIAEAAVFNRTNHSVEDTLRPSQYARCTPNGADLHLAVLADFISEHQATKRTVYVANLDIEGAFDAVPHEGLMSTLWGLDVDAYLEACLAYVCSLRRNAYVWKFVS